MDSIVLDSVILRHWTRWCECGLETGNLISYGVDRVTVVSTHLEIYPMGNRPMWAQTTELGG